MGEILFVIAGLSFLVLRTFQWARKNNDELLTQIKTLHAENAAQIKQVARLEAQLETCNDRRKAASKAAWYYKTKYLEQEIFLSKI